MNRWELTNQTTSNEQNTLENLHPIASQRTWLNSVYEYSSEIVKAHAEKLEQAGITTKTEIAGAIDAYFTSLMNQARFGGVTKALKVAAGIAFATSTSLAYANNDQTAKGISAIQKSPPSAFTTAVTDTTHQQQPNNIQAAVSDTLQTATTDSLCTLEETLLRIKSAGKPIPEAIMEVETEQGTNIYALRIAQGEDQGAHQFDNLTRVLNDEAIQGIRANIYRDAVLRVFPTGEGNYRIRTPQGDIPMREITSSKGTKGREIILEEAINKIYSQELKADTLTTGAFTFPIEVDLYRTVDCNPDCTEQSIKAIIESSPTDRSAEISELEGRLAKAGDRILTYQIKIQDLKNKLPADDPEENGEPTDPVVEQEAVTPLRAEVYVHGGLARMSGDITQEHAQNTTVIPSTREMSYFGLEGRANNRVGNIVLHVDLFNGEDVNEYSTVTNDRIIREESPPNEDVVLDVSRQEVFGNIGINVAKNIYVGLGGGFVNQTTSREDGSRTGTTRNFVYGGPSIGFTNDNVDANVGYAFSKGSNVHNKTNGFEHDYSGSIGVMGSVHTSIPLNEEKNLSLDFSAKGAILSLNGESGSYNKTLADARLKLSKAIGNFELQAGANAFYRNIGRNIETHNKRGIGFEVGAKYHIR
ncbi:MAG: hypothetical protein ACMXYD_03780 [Candidatus Woesearchaeota archaeon]